MPLEEIQAVITTPDLAARNELITGHLRRLETVLARTQQAAASLRDLLEPPVGATPSAIEHRRVAAATAVAVSDVIGVQEADAWFQGALGELHAVLAAQKVSPTGPGGGIYGNEMFYHERGEATVFVPCGETVRPTGRVTTVVVPEVELAVAVHIGPHTDVDLAYGALATYVSDHALAVEGPVREYYLIGPHETQDATRWHTEIGWPIFHTGQTDYPVTRSGGPSWEEQDGRPHRLGSMLRAEPPPTGR